MDITWCDIVATYTKNYGNTCNDKSEEMICSEDVLKRFADTAKISTSDWRYFCGEQENRSSLTLRNVNYCINGFDGDEWKEKVETKIENEKEYRKEMKQYDKQYLSEKNSWDEFYKIQNRLIKQFGLDD